MIEEDIAGLEEALRAEAGADEALADDEAKWLDKEAEAEAGEEEAHTVGEGLATLVGEWEDATLCACGHSLGRHPEGKDCIVADCECDGFEPAPADPRERAAEVYRYEAPQQLMIPTMTADAKVGLITSQVQQIERLVAIMLAVLAVRKDDGTAPYDLWSKALEPAEDAQVLLQGVVKLLKTRNRNRY